MKTRLAWAVGVLIVVTSVWNAVPYEMGAAGTARQEGSSVQQPRPGMQDMMKMHEQMMAEMKASRTKLDALVKDMNSASGSAKVDAIAAVVTELARQHDVMYERMSEMHGRMMSGRGMMGGRNMMGR